MEYTKEQQIEIMRSFVKEQVDRCNDIILLDLVWKMFVLDSTDSTPRPKTKTVTR